MKKLLLSIFMAFYAISTYSQATIFVQTPISTAGTSALRAPNGTTAHTTLRAAFIIPASELNGILNTNAVIKRLGFVYETGVSSAAGGNFKIYLQNTTDASYSKSNVWATAITGMTQVYDGNYNLPVGATTAATTDIGLNNNFTYTGGGLYVAYDYLGSQFATTSAIYRCDNSIPNSLANASSNTTTPPDSFTASSSFRPSLLFGMDNPYQNDIAVNILDIGYGETDRIVPGTITAIVQNKGAQNASNIQVSLNVTGANPNSQIFTIPSLNAGASTQVSFNMVNVNVGTQNIVVSVPNDERNTNNSMQKAQQVGCGELASYNSTDAPYDGIGFGSTAGLLALKYLSPAVGVSISSVKVHITTATTSVGKQIGGVLLDDNGVILAESPLQTITSAMLNTKVVFNFPTAVNIPANTSYYVAIKQTAGSPDSYYPVGTFAPANILAGRVYSFAITGGAKIEYTNLGTLMIGATLNPYATISSSTTGIINSGTSVTFTASPNFSQYIFKVNGNAMQTGAGNTYTYTPLNNDIVSVEAALNGCSAPAASITMQVDPSLPIRLYSFTVQKEQQKVKVNWQTLTETNNKEFIVGRSTDGIHYTEIAKVPGAINSLGRKYYQVVDATPAPGINYYKLEQLDLDGQLTEIGIKALDFSFTGNQLSLYPNPVKNVLNINFVSNTFNQLQLSDVTGKVVYQAQLNAQSQAYQINLSGYPVGVYILLLKGAQQQLQQKVIKD
ncbi:T9SS type A sorting domain-containing protein [Pedobacter sp.]|uniref:T9SS type A sorting domain-containing protein n=1 Tax=Pedobacter sp. TaxID=1411316 RepID=UPI00396CE976